MENDFLNQAKEELTEYGRSVGEVGKLRLVGIISRVLGLFLLILTIVLCALAVFTFAAVALKLRVLVLQPGQVVVLVIFFHAEPVLTCH